MARAGREQPSVNIATIDIGTNTVLLLVAAVEPGGALLPLAYEQRIPRLGRGVDAHRMLQRASIERVVDVLREYARMIERYRVDCVVVSGTSAVRDAANRQELASAIAQATGYDLEVLSGEEEAVWTYRGALSGMTPLGSAAVLDIGGGSTEISVGDGTRIRRQWSLDVGSVRLTERCFRGDPPSPPEIQDALTIIDAALDTVDIPPSHNARWVGVAGTATTLATVALGNPSFSMETVANTPLTYSQVVSWSDRFSSLPASRIRHISPVLEGRADVILAGTLILRRMMERFHLTEILVSERGLRYGLVLREMERRRRGERKKDSGSE